MTSPRTGRPYLDAVLDQPGSVLALAHRGGTQVPENVGLENSLEAFDHAVRLGYGYLETDVHTTADGVLLAFHDAVLDRVTDRTGAIAALTHAEVGEARIGGRAEIPTMAGLLEAFPDARFNVDLKSDGAVRPLVELVERHAAHDRVLVGSFSVRRMTAFRRLSRGRVATSATPFEAVAFMAGPPLPRLRRWDALQVPHRRGRLPVTTSALVRRAHAAGKHVHVWTIDDPEEMDVLLDRHVDGLFTDRTDLLKDTLVRRGQWRTAP